MKLKESNTELLRDVEELTQENDKLLCKVKMLIDEESRLREQVHSQTQNEAELKTQLMKSFDGKASFKHTPEKDSHIDSTLKQMDHSSINVCPTCDSLREENKEIKSKLSIAKKESEMMNLQNQELLKQIKLMASSDYSHQQSNNQHEDRKKSELQVQEPKFRNNQESRNMFQFNPELNLKQLGSEIKPSREELSFRTPEISSKQAILHQDTPFKSNNADLAETLRSLQESKVKLEHFQQKMTREKEEAAGARQGYPPVPKRNHDFEGQGTEFGLKERGEEKSARDQYSNFMAKFGIASEQSILPAKKDFGSKGYGETSNKLKSYMSGSWGEKPEFPRENGGNENHYQNFSKTEGGFGLSKDRLGVEFGKGNPRSTAQGTSKEISVFKDLEKLDSFFKQDDIKIRSRRDDRLMATLDERIKADRSVDLIGKAYNRYGAQQNDQPSYIGDRKNRKSIGHAPQSRYLERLSKLYEGTDDHGGTSITQDQSFASTKRASSMDRTVLSNTDTFLKQINDRISNLVTK